MVFHYLSKIISMASLAVQSFKVEWFLPYWNNLDAIKHKCDMLVAALKAKTICNNVPRFSASFHFDMPSHK